jgi:hypothetical protein
MKIYLLILAFLLPGFSIGQSLNQLKNTIDSFVISTNSNDSLKQIDFFIKTKKKPFKNVFYTYSQRNDSILKISRKFKLSNDSIQQIFYCLNHRFVYSIEKIISYSGNDSTEWSGSFYFLNGKLIDLITLGHGKTENEAWDLEKNILLDLHEVFEDIKRNKK